MVLHLAPPTLADAESLLDFELANRAYFEGQINARDPAYYDLEQVRRAIETAAQERSQDRAYQYLIRVGDTLVGRVNLTGVARPYYNKASLGYRIGQDHGGRGYASQAVALVLEEAFHRLGLYRIEAIVRPDNLGSVKVLERNGFTEFGRARRSMLLNGVWHDLLHFECHGPDGRLAIGEERAAATV
ncbi:alanine acetyltransferase [Chitinimonas prasina]|uniref:Alanine acetyltransferase n=1 Tax=Chitinimonas prasina TaxID=1434937 RepID=A0ABQ5YNJ1_9NEIS|nr:GNAT family N-acetyltransferase [Chitinimonas prasina]GLR14504.1 alanine acetyltransferase [Chitinimonas prasina]